MGDKETTTYDELDMKASSDMSASSIIMDMTVMKGRMFEYDLLQFNSERADDDGTPKEVRSGKSLISLPAKHLVILD